MTSVQSPVAAGDNPSHTFMDKKPPLMPRQSTSDVLSFTHIIADRLAPGQNVWEYFSPAPAATHSPLSVDTSASLGGKSASLSSGATSPVLPLSPTSPAAASPTSSSSFSFFGGGSKRQSMVVDTSKLPPLPPQPSQSRCASPTSITFAESNSIASSTATTTGVTPKAQKRRSFAQSLRSMLSLSQLISSSTKPSTQPTGPPHYNILVLGSDSAPLASTLYKMSSLLPSTNKISHYQEISGFFVAYFRSNGSFTCSPKTSTDLERRRTKRLSFRMEGEDGEVKTRRRSSGSGMEEIDQEPENEDRSSRRNSVFLRRSSGESDATLLNARLASAENGYESDSKAEEATLCQEPLSTPPCVDESESSTIPLSASANASLSVHAFSLDTTWPVPRLLAQTFWFPHAHGIIYIVDATRKNDPRGMDHLLNARQFLASLVTDSHFRRRDIPVVVFANKAGMDDETCFRVDEIAEILGCEEWDDAEISLQASNFESTTATGAKGLATPAGSPASRPWCVKSTRSDGEGEGLRESVEWLKSRMGEIWKSQ